MHTQKFIQYWEIWKLGVTFRDGLGSDKYEMVSIYLQVSVRKATKKEFGNN